MNKEEKWKKVNGFENYEVSDLGRVRNCKYNNYLLPNKSKSLKNGYYRVNLSTRLNNKRKVFTKYVHVLVADNFIKQNYLGLGLFCNHIDGDKSNNKLDNLELVTKSENEKHAFRIGLKCLKGNNHNRAKINLDIANEIKEMLSNGIKRRLIADKYNISLSTVSSIKIKRTWNY